MIDRGGSRLTGRCNSEARVLSSADVSQELDIARQHVAEGNYKKALSRLWMVLTYANANAVEARGLIEVASAISTSSTGRVQKDANLLLGNARDALQRSER